MTSGAQTSPAILNPRCDLWLAGGLSIVVLTTLALIGLLSRPDFLLQDFLILTVLINGTHFMASYRLLYSSRAFARRYPWASFYVPGFLILYIVLSCLLTFVDPRALVLLQGLQAVSVLYLALHYTGQAWGMVSSFAFLEGVRLANSERIVLRRTLHVLVVWHLFWGIKQLWQPSIDYAGPVRLVDGALNSAALVALVVGISIFYRISKRIGRCVPLRMLMPYLALFIWYSFMYLFPESIFWVQIFHALQYIPFPLRVELNRTQEGEDPRSYRRHAYLYLATMLMTSALLFGLLPWMAKSAGTGAYNMWVAIAAGINIHHFYIDGCIWRISNPVVSQELFAHTRSHAD